MSGPRKTTPPPQAYTSILDAPLDPYDVPDVGDEAAQSGTPLVPSLPKALTAAQRRAAEKPPTRIIPFTRTISLGTVGKDVKGAKRAIWNGNGLGVPKLPTVLFGPLAAKQLRKFQSDHGLTADGQLGPATLVKLAPYFDSYAFLLYTGYPPGGSKTQQIRNAIVAYAVWGYNNRVEIHYAEFRPMTSLNQLEILPITEDCSTFATKAYKYAGATDPNGLGYNGYGFTGTMRQHGRVVSRSQARPGDLVHYDGPAHVAIYVGNDRVISLGSEPGPDLSSIDYRAVVEIRSYFLD